MNLRLLMPPADQNSMQRAGRKSRPARPIIWKYICKSPGGPQLIICRVAPGGHACHETPYTPHKMYGTRVWLSAAMSVQGRTGLGFEAGTPAGVDRLKPEITEPQWLSRCNPSLVSENQAAASDDAVMLTRTHACSPVQVPHPADVRLVDTQAKG